MTAAFRAAVSVPYKSGQPSAITVPNTVQVGDLLVLDVVTESITTRTPPAGWTEQVQKQIGPDYGRGCVWTKVATAGDIGSTITLTLTGADWALGLVAYSDAAIVAGSFKSTVVAPTTIDIGPGSGQLPHQTATGAGQIYHGGWLRYGPYGASQNWGPDYDLSPGGPMTRRVNTDFSATNTGGWDSIGMGDKVSTAAGDIYGAPTSTISSGRGVFGYSMLLGPATPPPPPTPPTPAQHETLPTRLPVTTSARRIRRRGWRYMATRLNGDGTETMIDPDLPLEDVQIDDVLSGDQQLNAKIDPSVARLIGADGHPTLLEWGTAIYAENDGDIRFGGILASTGLQGPTLSLECIGYTGYSRDMPYTGGGYKGIKVDPLDVVRTIWQHIQNQPGGNIGLGYDVTTTDGAVLIGSALAADDYDPEGDGINGVALETQAFKLNRYTNHDLASDIDALAEATPFDYHERHYWDGDVIRHHIDFGYPTIGRKRDDLRFVLGVNVFEAPEVERDGDIYASGTLVLGAGTGSAAKWSLREPANRPAGRLRRIAVVTDDTLKSDKRCAARADRENNWRRHMDDITTVNVVDHPNARLGEAKVGDTIVLQGRSDWDTFDLEVRITGITYEPANGNVAQYTVARTDKLS